MNAEIVTLTVVLSRALLRYQMVELVVGFAYGKLLQWAHVIPAGATSIGGYFTKAVLSSVVS